MTLSEFSNSFDLLVNSYSSQYSDIKVSTQDLSFNEYEKSVFLTLAQKEIIQNLYNGKNTAGDFFESTEELRRCLDELVKTKVYYADRIEDVATVESGTAVSDNSVFFKLPEDLAFITLEQVTYYSNDSELKCYTDKGTTLKADVYPVRHDEYSRVKDNPFRGPTKYKALRLDYGNEIVEIVPKYTIMQYLIKYVAQPTPIILVDLPDGLSIDGKNEATDCKVSPLLHNIILERAVIMALSTKNIKTKSE